MNKKIDLVVSFDTTGSMYPVLAQVRQQVEDFVKEMFTEFTDLRLGIIAHGDYCDKDNPYTIMVMDLTRDKDKLCSFVRDVKQTYGGDADECYELVLNTAANVLNWREDAQKAMLMIGDASPHGPMYHMNKDRLDWKNECVKLAEKGVTVFAVHALSYYRSSSRAFYKSAAEITGGTYLTLDQFNEIVDLIKATCYQQSGEEKLNEFITIIKDSGKYTNSMERNIKRLQGIEVIDDMHEVYTSRTPRKRRRTDSEEVKIIEMDDMIPVMPGRFQTMKVEKDMPIKAFVEENGIAFKKGRGFYELTKHEKVQQYKEIIAQDRETGEMFTGAQVREKLGLSPQSEKGGVTEKLSSRNLAEFRVFVQSTSVNRKLIGGTTLLYEIMDIEDTGTKIEEVEVPAAKKKETPKMEEKPVDKEPKAKDKKEKDVKPVEVAPVEVEPAVKEEKKPAKKKGNKKDKVENAPELAKGTVEFEEVEPIDVKPVVEFKADTKKKVIKAPVEKKPSAKEKAEAKTITKLEQSADKVKQGLERYGKSKNKKNVAFLTNNLNKLIKEAQELVDSINKSE